MLMVNYKIEPTFTATIYVGTLNTKTGAIKSLDEIRVFVQHYVNLNPTCVTVTPTEFYYVGNSEIGVAVGLINYPRFPLPAAKIRFKALELARQLLEFCEQERVSVVFPDETIMLAKFEETT